MKKIIRWTKRWSREVSESPLCPSSGPPEKKTNIYKNPFLWIRYITCHLLIFFLLFIFNPHTIFFFLSFFFTHFHWNFQVWWTMTSCTHAKNSPGIIIALLCGLSWARRSPLWVSVSLLRNFFLFESAGKMNVE